MQTGPVPKILAIQNEARFWDKEEDFYNHKYKRTVWNIIYWQIGGRKERTFEYDSRPNSCIDGRNTREAS